MPNPKVVGTSAVKPDVRYTVADYRTWPDEERWELIDGIAYSMSPAPRSAHQRMSRMLFSRIDAFLEGKSCEPFYAPIDVFLPHPGESGEEENTVVQPDILVVCDPAKVADEGIRGAPDFVVEILSDTTAYKDLNEKKDLYESHGVREYWIVKPADGSVLAWRLEDGRYAPVKEYRGEEPVDSVALAGFVWPPRRRPS